MTDLLTQAFELLRQQDETMQNGVAQAILDFITVTTPEPEGVEIEADEEIEWLSAMTDEQFESMQRWLADRAVERLTQADLDADALGHFGEPASAFQESDTL